MTLMPCFDNEIAASRLDFRYCCRSQEQQQIATNVSDVRQLQTAENLQNNSPRFYIL